MVELIIKKEVGNLKSAYELRKELNLLDQQIELTEQEIDLYIELGLNKSNHFKDLEADVKRYNDRYALIKEKMKSVSFEI